jgi:hypothetical protein
MNEADRQFAYAVINDLPMCGCGDPRAALALVLRVLGGLNSPTRLGLHGDWTASTELPDDAVRYLVLGALDHAELIDHGTSVDYPWLTDKGRRFLEVMDRGDYDEIDAGGFGPHDHATYQEGAQRADTQQRILDALYTATAIRPRVATETLPENGYVPIIRHVTLPWDLFVNLAAPHLDTKEQPTTEEP